MKSARTMKVLYHMHGGIQADLAEPMNFVEGESASGAKKLKQVDFLIDLHISISKIHRNVVLTTDG